MKAERSTRRFWVWGFIFLLLAHAAAVFRFSERNALVPWRPPVRPFFYLSLDAKSDQRIAELTADPNPTLFALPHARGFSGGAWLSFRPEIPKLSNWSAPPEWLQLPLDQLGSALHEYITTNRVLDEQLLASLRMPRNVEVRIPDEPVITNTTVRVEGPLSHRKLISLPMLPPAEFTDVLHRTFVAIAVNGDGVVETASLVGESGSGAADSRAVELARNFVFEPAPIRNARAREALPPTFGRLVFTWQVMPLLPPTAATASAP